MKNINIAENLIKFSSHDDKQNEGENEKKKKSFTDCLKKLSYGLVDSPEPLLGAETIQLILAREIHDFTVLRTEPTRELNTTVTPVSLSDMAPLLRVVFLASKQKAVESRSFRSILKSARIENNISDSECYLKDNLCMNCPRCILFGAVKTEKGKQEAIKHRVGYGTAFSMMPYEDIEMVFTFNAVDERTQSTGQALGTRFSVSPSTIFPSIVTLRCVTWKEFVMIMKTLLSTANYGAENRIGGQIRNHIIGIVAGWEEIITPLELSLELYDTYIKNGQINLNPTDGNQSVQTSILEKYKNEAVFGNKIHIVTDDSLEDLIKSMKSFELSKEFLKALDQDATDFKSKSKARSK
jgi:CRISPR type I-D-associated protein Csc2